MNKNYFIMTLIVIFCFASGAKATEINTVVDVNKRLEHYASQAKEILKGPLPLTKKALQLSRTISSFKNERRQAYSHYRVKIRKKDSCTNGVSGNRKRCGPSRASCPVNTTVIQETLNWVPKPKGGCYSLNKSVSGFTFVLSQTGKGRKVCEAEALCKYSSSHISNKITDEVEILEKRINNIMN